MDLQLTAQQHDMAILFFYWFKELSAELTQFKFLLPTGTFDDRLFS